MKRCRPQRASLIGRGRRGVAMAIVLVVVVILGLTVAGSIRPLAQEADLASLRVETTRAFYAAESGVTMVIGSINAGADPPQEGSEILLGNQTIRFVRVGNGSEGITVEGVSGMAARRVLLDLE